MFQERNEYRKKLNSSGQIYLGGVDLEFTGSDISVKGMRIELEPGGLIADINDVNALIKEITVAEIYVSELMLTGEVEIVWVNSEKNKIIMGLEFRDVIYNAKKMWRKRKYYRKQVKEFGHLIVNDNIIDFECRDISIDGMRLYVKNREGLSAGHVVKVVSEALAIKAMAKIIWLNEETDGQGAMLGLRYFTIE